MYIPPPRPTAAPWTCPCIWDRTAIRASSCVQTLFSSVVPLPWKFVIYNGVGITKGRLTGDFSSRKMLPGRTLARASFLDIIGHCRTCASPHAELIPSLDARGHFRIRQSLFLPETVIQISIHECLTQKQHHIEPAAILSPRESALVPCCYFLN